jgi:hypothetical protein
MEVKGTAFLARKAMLEREIGAERFAELLRTAAQRDAVFGAPILATTRIPIDAFIRFNEIIVKRVYDGDEQSYFRFGEQSAAWALSGPYKHLVDHRSIDEFVESAALIYRNYFTEGEARATRRGRVVELRIDGIPRRWGHAYFEYAITGYFGRGLEVVSGAPVEMHAVKGFVRGDDRVAYEYTLAAAP